MRRVLPTRLLRGGRRGRRLFLLVLLPLLVTAGAVEQPAFSRTRALPYQDASLPAATRADDLLGRMTLAEKVGQLAQVSVSQLKTDADLERVFAEEGVGSILSGGGELPGSENNPRAWAEGINRIQKAALDRSRLGIPILYGADAPHGLSPVLGAVIFPQQIGMGATRDPALVRQVATVTSRGAKALGIRWIFGPVADVSRDLRWGRYYETYSEDPKLASSLVAATVGGLQGNNANQLAVAATAKHFIGYSQPRNGRDRFPVTLSSATLAKWFVPPFQAAVDAGAATVMTQHSAVNGTPVVASHALSTDLLRDTMRFRGVLISDWGDVADLYCPGGIPPNPKFTCVASSPKDAVGRAVSAGVDVTMIPYDSAQFTSALKDLVQRGTVSQKRLDEAVRRVLTLKFRLGLFEHPYVDAGKAQAGVLAAGDRKLARKAVGESLTLLKNNRRVLPLKKRGGPILVVGPAASNVSWQMGGWTIGWQGLPAGAKPPAVTVLQGIREEIGARKVLTANWHNQADVRAKAKKARAIVVAIGEKAYAEWYGDNPSGALAPNQVRLIEAAEAGGKPVVLVLVTGRPLMISGLVEKAGALLMAYLPGSEGGHGVADVLFGRVSPRGKLPVSWPASIKDVPMVKGIRLKDGKRAKPLFAYGAGLSYK
ncbi:MAG TPA: glycoside hydrolase family 3 N-terminal domain-containing protein [Gaiellaceae bacterium]|jgi:beta-glucosidase